MRVSKKSYDLFKKMDRIIFRYKNIALCKDDTDDKLIDVLEYFFASVLFLFIALATLISVIYHHIPKIMIIDERIDIKKKQEEDEANRIMEERFGTDEDLSNNKNK